MQAIRSRHIMLCGYYVIINIFLLFCVKQIYSWPLRDNVRSSFLANRKAGSTCNETIPRSFKLLASIQKPKHRRNATDMASGVNIDDYLFEEVDIDVNSFLGPEISWLIENDFFTGHVCLLVRDHPRCRYSFDNQTDIYFEVQVQGRFKRKPKGPVYLGIEIPKKKQIKLSWPLRTFLKAAIAFMKSWGYKWVHFTLGEEDLHVPLISTPAFQAFDRVVITPIGEEPPPLGFPIPDNNNAAKRKSFNFDHNISINNIYTMSINHTYIDVVNWKVTNIPLVNSFHFNFTDSIRLTMYEIDQEQDDDTDGHVEAIATTKMHKKRDVVFWIKLRKQ